MNPIIKMFVQRKVNSFLKAEWLEGYRTVIIGLVYGAVTVAQSMGFAEDPALWNLAETLKGLCIGTGLVTLREGVKNDIEKATAVNVRKKKLPRGPRP